MAKTREQKEQEVQDLTSALEASDGCIALQFEGVPVNKLNSFRRDVERAGGKFRVVKKRLLGLVFGKKNISLSLENVTGQIGLLTYTGELSSPAGVAYRFTDQFESAGIAGAFNTVSNEEVSTEYVIRIGQLPPRDVLLGTVVGGIAAPLRAFMYVLKQLQKVVPNE